MQRLMSLMLTTATLEMIATLRLAGLGWEDIFYKLRLTGHKAEPSQVREIVLRRTR